MPILVIDGWCISLWNFPQMKKAECRTLAKTLQSKLYSTALFFVQWGYLSVWKSGLSAAILGRYYSCVVSWHIDRSHPVPNNSFCQACACHCHCVMVIIIYSSTVYLMRCRLFVEKQSHTVKKHIWAFHFYVQWHTSSNWKTALALIEYKHWIINMLAWQWQSWMYNSAIQ